MPPPIAGPSMPAAPEQASGNGPHGLSLTSHSDDSDDDDFMPALPPPITMNALPTTKSSKNIIGPIGPTLPPSGLRKSIDTESDSDNDFAGPMPLPSHLNKQHHEEEEADGVQALREREDRQAEKDRLEMESKVLKRDEWMLVPPKELDLPASIDPTKIKSRGFKQTSKPHSSTTEHQTGSGSLWTETPTERVQRLEDEAMGKRRRAEDVAKDIDNDDDSNLDKVKRRKRDREMRKQVEEHNKSVRGSSLLDLHKTASSNISKSKTKAEKEKEKKEMVVWDHDSMMGLGGKLMSEKQKADMVRDAKGLGGRFGGGSFL